MHFQLTDIELAVFLGVPEQERSQAQTIKVGVSFDYDTQKAEQSDEVVDTFDYEKLYHFIKAFPGERPFKLLERLHTELLQALKTEFPELQNLTLQIEKYPFADAIVRVRD